MNSPDIFLNLPISSSQMFSLIPANSYSLGNFPEKHDFLLISTSVRSFFDTMPMSRDFTCEILTSIPIGSKSTLKIAWKLTDVQSMNSFLFFEFTKFLKRIGVYFHTIFACWKLHLFQQQNRDRVYLEREGKMSEFCKPVAQRTSQEPFIFHPIVSLLPWHAALCLFLSFSSASPFSPSLPLALSLSFPLLSSPILSSSYLWRILCLSCIFAASVFYPVTLILIHIDLLSSGLLLLNSYYSGFSRLVLNSARILRGDE